MKDYTIIYEIFLDSNFNIRAKKLSATKTVLNYIITNGYNRFYINKKILNVIQDNTFRESKNIPHRFVYSLEENVRENSKLLVQNIKDALNKEIKELETILSRIYSVNENDIYVIDNTVEKTKEIMDNINLEELKL